MPSLDDLARIPVPPSNVPEGFVAYTRDESLTEAELAELDALVLGAGGDVLPGGLQGDSSPTPGIMGETWSQSPPFYVLPTPSG